MNIFKYYLEALNSVADYQCNEFKRIHDYNVKVAKINLEEAEIEIEIKRATKTIKGEK